MAAKKATKKAVKEETEEQKSFHIEVVDKMLTLATSGFGLVAALAWNSFIQELVNNYVKGVLPEGSGLISLFVYAVIVTILAVVVTLQLSRLLKKLKNDK